MVYDIEPDVGSTSLVANNRGAQKTGFVFFSINLIHSVHSFTFLMGSTRCVKTAS